MDNCKGLCMNAKAKKLDLSDTVNVVCLTSGLFERRCVYTMEGKGAYRGAFSFRAGPDGGVARSHRYLNSLSNNSK